MNLRNLFLRISIAGIVASIGLHADDQHLAAVPTEQPAQQLQTIPEAVIDPTEAHDTDYTFFNDPYLMEQYEAQPLADLSSMKIAGINDTGEAVVDPLQAYDAAFSFFNDPYAFEFFNDLPIKAKFGGYIQYSSWWDNRQVYAPADGYILFFPLPKLFDADCKDINARGDYNSGFLETRLRAEFYGPNILGAETYGYLETDFIGSPPVDNRMRIRQAMMKFTWGPSNVLLGQSWNPAFEPRCYPLTIDFGAGEPNAIYARNPQIRYTYANNNKEFIIAAAAQIEQTNTGPLGPDSVYLRNSRLPMLYARGAYDNEHIYAGLVVGFQRIVPRLESNTCYRVREYISSCLALCFARLTFGKLDIRQNLIFSQNATDLTLLGGYAVSNVHPVTDERTYTNLNTLTYWMDINLAHKIEPGLFVGIAKNFGARQNIIQCLISPATGTEEVTVYGLGLNIDTLFRVAPRIRWHMLPLDFCVELDIVRAAYGCLNNKGQVKNKDPVTDVRLLLTTFFYF